MAPKLNRPPIPERTDNPGLSAAHHQTERSGIPKPAPADFPGTCCTGPRFIPLSLRLGAINPKETPIPILKDRALLVHPALSSCTFRKTDKRATAQFVTEHGASHDAGHFIKHLLSPDQPQLAAIEKLDDQIRAFHREHTLPWMDDGPRILPTALFEDYMGPMRQWRNQRQTLLVPAFLAVYESAVLERRSQLNGLFNPRDYPDVEKLKKRFAFEVRTLPLPDQSDFRVTMAEDAMQELRSSVSLQLTEAHEAGRLDMFRRLAEPVAHMANVLRQPEKIFRDSLVTNIRQIVALLPKLNAAVGDPVLNELIQSANALAAVDPDTLRDSKNAREQKATEARAILERMADYLNPLEAAA